jgi:hypothetical protein
LEKDTDMRIRNSLLFNLAILGMVAALLTIPGEAKQPVPATAAAPQATFGLFLDPHATPVLSIDLARGPRDV